MNFATGVVGLLELCLKLLNEGVNNRGPGEVRLPDVGFGPQKFAALAFRGWPVHTQGREFGAGWTNVHAVRCDGYEEKSEICRGGLSGLPKFVYKLSELRAGGVISALCLHGYSGGGLERRNKTVLVAGVDIFIQGATDTRGGSLSLYFC